MNLFEARECMNAACIFNDMTQFKEAIQNGVDLKKYDDDFIQTAIKNCSTDVLEALFQHGLEIEKKDYETAWNFLKLKKTDAKIKKMQKMVSEALKTKILSVAKQNRKNKTEQSSSDFIIGDVVQSCIKGAKR